MLELVEPARPREEREPLLLTFRFISRLLLPARLRAGDDAGRGVSNAAALVMALKVLARC